MTMTKFPSTSTEAQDVAVPDDVDPAAPAKRRHFTAEQKLTILAEYEAAIEPGAKGAILRREAIYSSHVSEWRRARDAGSLAGLKGDLGSKRETNKAEVARLEHKNARLEAELTKTKAALDIMGKVHALLETLSESADTVPTSTS
jgi:transposase-like protein